MQGHSLYRESSQLTKCPTAIVLKQALEKEKPNQCAHLTRWKGPCSVKMLQRISFLGLKEM